MENLSYPVGKFAFPRGITDDDCLNWTREIAEAPAKVRAAIEGLNATQLDTPYRDGGWTVRQVVHHLADSHANAYLRMRRALTEETPTIQPYDQSAWAELSDAKSGPVEPSLRMLEALHERWVALVESLQPAELRRAFIHPELDTNVSLQSLLAMYAWHGRHHVAHITRLRERENW